MANRVRKPPLKRPVAHTGEVAPARIFRWRHQLSIYRSSKVTQAAGQPVSQPARAGVDSAAGLVDNSVSTTVLLAVATGGDDAGVNCNYLLLTARRKLRTKSAEDGQTFAKKKSMAAVIEGGGDRQCRRRRLLTAAHQSHHRHVAS